MAVICVGVVHNELIGEGFAGRCMLEEIDDAYDDMSRGSNICGVIHFDKEN